MPKTLEAIIALQPKRKQVVHDAAVNKTTEYSSLHSVDDIEYDQKFNKKGQERFPPLQSLEDDIYSRIVRAETGGLKDPWIRTLAVGSGSTAFGEAQITRGLIRGVLKQKDFYELDDSDVKFLKEMEQQGNLFLKYGGKDMKPGFERYDYGKKGDWTDDRIPQYRKTVKKVIKGQYREHLNAGGSIQDFWRTWRFGVGKLNDASLTDKRYEREYLR